MLISSRFFLYRSVMTRFPNESRQMSSRIQSDIKAGEIFRRLQTELFPLAVAYQSEFVFEDFKASSYSLEGYFHQLRLVGNYSHPELPVFKKTSVNISRDVKTLLESGCKPTHDLLYELFLFPYDLGSHHCKESLLIQLASQLEDVNRKDKSFISLLHYAVFHRYNELAKVLIEKGGNAFRKDHLGLSPYDLALYTRNKTLISILDPRVNVEQELSHVNIKFMSEVYKILDYTAKNIGNPNFHLMVARALPNLFSLDDSMLGAQIKSIYKPVQTINEKFCSPMYAAISQEDLEKVKLLVQGGWDFGLEEGYSKQVRRNNYGEVQYFNSNSIDIFKGGHAFFKAATQMISSCNLPRELKSQIESKQKNFDRFNQQLIE